MNSNFIKNFQQLEQATLSGKTDLPIVNSIVCTHSIVLPKGAKLYGANENGQTPMLSFNSGDGVGVTADNTVSNINITTLENQKAIFNALAEEDLGTFTFQNLKLNGMFSFIARKGTMKATINADHIDIITADARANFEQPQKFGVNTLQGAFTIYNYNKEPQSNLTVSATHISCGREDAPVKGSGIFICGAGDEGGWVTLKKLSTGDIYSNGMIPENTATMISAGVFIVNGVKAEEIQNNGKTTTYGSNDMVLDNWGEVKFWTVEGKVTSFGPSSIGFVNFGTVETFQAKCPVQTYGMGSRGYNQYDGTVKDISFESIETFGDGSIGVQISKKIGTLKVAKSITTHGSTGNSLVKGKNVELPAIALSVQEGGGADLISVGQNIETFGDGVTTYKVEKGGSVKNLEVGGELSAFGKDSQLQEIEN